MWLHSCKIERDPPSGKRGIYLFVLFRWLLCVRLDQLLLKGNRAQTVLNSKYNVSSIHMYLLS